MLRAIVYRLKQGIKGETDFGNDMGNRLVSVVMLMILVMYLPANALGNESTTVVPQFGVGFDEVVIADSSDALSDPRDLEFHPGRANELWIANRATDSITIVHNTGLENQTSQNRQDSHRNHFLEEVSAIAFGAYHPEFDWQWGSAQESANTYCGQGSPNNFMGPTLWPSSLSHFAMEHQNDNLLGSHIDMNHESPYGMGIAHDSGNSYWYNDGYYGELVYYDFQEDHDTGMDDHSDGIVRRYSDVQLTHSYGTPGHMVLDKDSGILYIADPGANRVVWVNTDDTTYNTQNIMSDSSRLEPLAEYSRITGIEWGVLDSGLSRPSGIAIEDDQLFVSQNGNSSIIAYDLSTNGKSATEAGSILTSASSIMGLEIGPNGHLYYVDNGQDEVIRIDPQSDQDGDGIADQDDNCPLISNPSQANHDNDAMGNICDEDDDNDGILDDLDNCERGELAWSPTLATDHDGDGCRDYSEDYDDDNDGVIDNVDRCSTGELGWISDSDSDYDSDGCKDISEDKDDDNDNICDSGWNEDWDCIQSSANADLCPQSHPTFFSVSSNDGDQDGCEDRNEDEDDDNDGFLDKQDDCPIDYGLSDSGRLFGCPDFDEDGHADSSDAFPYEPTQWSDIDEDGYGDESDGIDGDDCVTVYGNSTLDRRGCLDSDGDGWSNPDSNWNSALGADAFPLEETQHVDQDGDGYGDAATGFEADVCPEIFGTSSQDRFGCLDSDGDGWSDSGDMLPLDSTQHIDDDEDGFGDSPLGDSPDGCLGVFGLSNQQRYGCPDTDGDGWDDELDAYPNDSTLWSDTDGDSYADQPGSEISDDCPDVQGDSYEDRLGCLDSDGDGWSDKSDAFPNDATKHAESGASTTAIISVIGIILFGIIATGFVFLNRRKNKTDFNSNFDLSTPQAILSDSTPNAPPLPPEGLPTGWTMEQWAWYGEDYLRER